MLFLFIFSQAVALSTPPAHDIHVSMTEISRSSDDRLAVAIKIFTDDLQQALGLVGGSETSSEYKGSDQLIQAYVSRVFRLQNEGTLIDWSYEESLASGDAIWVYLKSKKPCPMGEYKLYNDVLHDLFDDQTNMIKILGKKKQTLLLNKDKKTVSISL